MYECVYGDKYIIKQYIQQTYGKYTEVESIKDIFPNLFSISLFDDITCYVVENDKFITDKIEQKLRTSPYNIVHITKDKGKEFTPLNENQIIKMLTKQFPNVNNISELVHLCNCDVPYILLELNKIINSDYDLFSENMIGDKEQEVFEYTNAFVTKDISKVIKLNEQYNNEWLLIFKLLHNNIINAIRIYDLPNDYTIAKNINMYYDTFKRAKNITKVFTKQELLCIIKHIYETEKQVKTGKIIQDNVLDIFTIKCFSNMSTN